MPCWQSPSIPKSISMAEIVSKEAQKKSKAGICFRFPSHNKHTSFCSPKEAQAASFKGIESAGPIIHGEVESKEEHEVHLKLVLESLRKEKLYAKFSKLLNSLTSLTEMNQKYEWSVEQEEAFQTLKLRWMIYLVVLSDVVENVRDAIGFEYYPSIFDALNNHSEILSDSNDDGTSSDDDDFEDIEYVSLEEVNNDQEEKEFDL
ncbi:hypothetical protein Tco_0591631 [Tanacetum coccineum]